MRISVGSYSGFKAICVEMNGASGPAHVFYGDDGSGNAASILAIFTGGFYGDYSGVGIPFATVTADFPNAIAMGVTNISSAY